LSGLIDGEAHFSIERIKGRNYSMHFALKLRDDDREVLEICRRMTGLGRLYDCPASDTKYHKANPQCAWRVYTKADVRALVELLDRYPLRSKKYRDYEIWREAVLLHETFKPGTRWTGTADYSKFAELKQKLQEGRRYEKTCLECKAA
jgi:hypothetical protein